jgi:hypothetical protein
VDLSPSDGVLGSRCEVRTTSLAVPNGQNHCVKDLALGRLRRRQVTQHPLKTLAVAIVALPAGEISDMALAEEQSCPVIL